MDQAIMIHSALWNQLEYSPLQGRWLQPDPAGTAAVNPSDPQSWNRYAYVENSPMNAVDALGLDEIVCGFGDYGFIDMSCGDQPDNNYVSSDLNGLDYGPALGQSGGIYSYYNGQWHLSGFAIYIDNAGMQTAGNLSDYAEISSLAGPLVAFDFALATGGWQTTMEAWNSQCH